MDLSRAIRLVLWRRAFFYGSYVRLRARLYARGWLKRKRLKGMVVSIGNLTVGGTGKTPMVIWLTQQLLAQGKRVAILSRGYRSANGTSDEIDLMRQLFHDLVSFC